MKFLCVKNFVLSILKSILRLQRWTGIAVCDIFEREVLVQPPQAQ